LLRVVDELAKSQPAESAQQGSDLLAPASGPLDDPANRVAAQAQPSEAQSGAPADMEGSTGTN
jgi:hypothetical protein